MDSSSLTTKKHINEAEAQGCKLMGAGRGYKYRLYELPCGHHQEVSLRHMRDGGFRCRICLAKKLDEEAKAQGCKIIAAGKDRNSKLYALPCGHEQGVIIGNMRKKDFRCSICLAEAFRHALRVDAGPLQLLERQRVLARSRTDVEQRRHILDGDFAELQGAAFLAACPIKRRIELSIGNRTSTVALEVNH